MVRWRQVGVGTRIRKCRGVGKEWDGDRIGHMYCQAGGETEKQDPVVNNYYEF